MSSSYQTTLDGKKLPTGVTRVQSPSSINTWKQCPRKYFYRYIAKLPSFPSIHLTRGKAVHNALENFFETDVGNVPDEQFLFTMKIVLNEQFKKEWRAFEAELDALPLTREQLIGYYDESREMINNYFEYFQDKMHFFMRSMPVKEAWKAVTPEREIEFSSPQHHVRGFIDAIHQENGKTLILDYKTSKKAAIGPEYQLQLGIYAMLYEEQHTTPDLVGIYFLKHGKEMLLDVTPEMIESARQEVGEVHLGTQTKSLGDYPKKPGPLCRWSTGQCDYYEYCFEGKEIPEKNKQFFISVSS